MNLPEIKYCPSTLQPGFTSYCPAAQLALFGGRSKKVPHLLSFGPPGKNKEQTTLYHESVKRISISGVQEKYSLTLLKNRLQLSDSGGTHILKPIPSLRLERIKDLPANEHVSMQLARQVFGIKTAACGMIFFSDGSPAYITRRFDYKSGSAEKYQVEDFAALMGKTPESEGDHFKYNASYLNIAELIQKHVAAAPVVLLDFFRLILFNYIIANGDAHLKNFSLMETDHGDFVLSPAYDLLCTELHIDDSSLALRDGLYEGDYLESSYQRYGTYTRTSFINFAIKAGIHPKLAGATMDQLRSKLPQVKEFLQRCFLSKEAKTKYINIVEGRYLGLALD